MAELDNVKIGDKVVLHGVSGLSIVKVTGITKGGLIKVNGWTFYTTGAQRGGDTWHSLRISVVTPQLEKQIKDEATVKKAYSLCQAVVSGKIKLNAAQSAKLVECFGKL